MTSFLLPAPRREAVRSDLLERQLRRFHPRLQGAVRLLATRHMRVGDLAASFPALLFALAVPRPGFDPAPALARVTAGFSLAEVAAAADVPMWLRKLPPEAFTRSIGRLPDGPLFRRQIANHLPSRKLAPAWLQAVADTAEFAHEPAAVWIARELVREPRCVKPDRLRLIGLWAWFSGQPETFGHTLIDKPWTPDLRIGPAIASEPRSPANRRDVAQGGVRGRLRLPAVGLHRRHRGRGDRHEKLPSHLWQQPGP